MKLILSLMFMLTSVYAAQVCGVTLSNTDDIAQQLKTSKMTSTLCYNFERSDTCLRLEENKTHKVITLSSSYFAVSKDKGFEFQKRSQLGFYGRWMNVIEDALYERPIRAKQCTISKGIRRCRIELDKLQSLTVYQSLDKDVWITDYLNNGDHQIHRWSITGDPNNPKLTCPHHGEIT